METYQLLINAHDRPGSLERILRVIRHRGCKVVTLNMQTHDQTRLLIKVELTNVKSKQQIYDQLLKLADIVTMNEQE
ncbi:acetolactate synthase small subunit [Orbus hercynius]|uniref:Acetolactate synthase small subunit n=1 Tax=Orbus hercynius TaxID=593135 RepID=A0A495RHH1_9GAMM|nr:acetolactate synthase 2 small subunit [Orbus hercynius]RKS86977.1 acetolactate synthase small subunit [Orbus hercynius]